MINAEEARKYAKNPTPKMQYRFSLDYILYEIELASKMGKYSIPLDFEPTTDIADKLTSLGYCIKYLLKWGIMKPTKQVEISWNEPV